MFELGHATKSLHAAVPTCTRASVHVCVCKPENGKWQDEQHTPTLGSGQDEQHTPTLGSGQDEQHTIALGSVQDEQRTLTLACQRLLARVKRQ